MLSRSTGLALALCCASALSLHAQEQRLAERFRLVFGHGEEGMYLYSMPDSTSRNMLWPGRDTALWAFDMYLFSNYAAAHKELFDLEKQLPDTVAILARYRSMLDGDTTFARLYRNGMPDRPVPAIHFDTLLHTASRFFYLHRSRGGVTAHICTGMNKVKELPKSPGSPYYAAFCYQVIRSLDDPFAIFYRAKDALRDSLYNTMPDELLHQAEQEIYHRCAADPELRRLLMEAYASKQRYLNFKVEE
ncbi:MAG: hypothetical protein IT230_01210 [Flavobacteriales bacterium]|nr:hypothetical protein [Flavobacteriales bacterium]